MKANISYIFLLISTVVATALLHVVRQEGPAAITPTSPTSPTSSQIQSSASPLKPIKSANNNPSIKKPQTTTASPSYVSGISTIINDSFKKNGTTYPLRVYKPSLIPNDTYANQWWVTPSSMPGVWDLPAPTRSTKIAIIDTGFGLSHQDLQNRWATNANESGSTATENSSQLNCTGRSIALNTSCNLIDDNYDGIVDNESGVTAKQNPSRLNCTDQGIPLDKQCNRVDDDSNGLVDDYRGWDFSNFDNNVQAGETNPGGSGTTHGTMVAGVLGATGNNGIGISGVNWYSQILPLQALNDDSYGNSITVSNAIHYAVDQGSDVISISLGTPLEDPYIREAVEYATDRGVLVVASSGNEGCNCISYPANYPEVIAVGALDRNNVPASFSNYGRNLDILAPGENMTSSYWTSGNPSNSYASNIAGTSFAAPFMSGLFGLGRSLQPNASWDEIVGAMFENADRRTLTTSSPRSDSLGFGSALGTNMLTRLSTPDTTHQRYSFGNNMVQGSNNIYQCTNTLPATLLYKLTKPSQQKYATGTLGYYNLSLQGWSQSELAYSCIGLPTDNPVSVRSIDLNREAFNLFLKP